MKAVLEKAEFDALSEPLQAEYKENGGKYVLDVDVESHPSIVGLRNTVIATRGERERLETELRKFKDIGDVDKAKEALAKIQQIEEENAKKAGEWDKLKGTLIEKHRDEQKKLEQQVLERDNDIQKLVVENQIRNVLSADDVKGNQTILLPHMMKRVKAERQADGTWIPVVYGVDGSKAVADGQGTPMTIKQLALELKANPDFAPNFVSTTRSGGGTPSGASSDAGRGAGGGGNKTVKRSSIMSPTQDEFEKLAKGEVTVEG